jgi:uncharacterized damage-inducible protein DinB
VDSLLRDLYGHQAWADAEHWRALEAHPPALADKAIRDRLHHIHIVQRSFRWIIGDRQTAFEFTTTEDFRPPGALKEYAREYHVEMAAFLDGLSDVRLAERIVVPWFRDPPLELTVARALAQGAMHSHYHRGQNATRLRELGGEPPMTDLIVWFWRGQPPAVWD